MLHSNAVQASGAFLLHRGLSMRVHTCQRGETHNEVQRQPQTWKLTVSCAMGFVTTNASYHSKPASSIKCR